MTQDQQDPTPQAPGATENTSPGDAESAAPTAAGTRTPRRRRTTSRSRKPKDQQEAQGAREQSKEQQSEQAPAAAIETAPAEQATPTAVATSESVTTPEAPKRASTRGRRSGNSHRRRTNKPEVPDVQLVPVVHAPEVSEAAESSETPEIAGPAEIEGTEGPQAVSLPAVEPLPLDAAILAHLDALSQATERPATEESISLASADEQLPTTAESAAEALEASAPPTPRRYRFDRKRAQSVATPAASRPERLSGWRATPPPLMAPPTVTPEVGPTAGEAQPGTPKTSAVSAEGEPAISAPEAPEAPEASETAELPAEAKGVEARAEEQGAATAVEGTAEGEEQAERESVSRRRRRRRGRNAPAQEAETDEGEGEEQHQERAARPATRQPRPYSVPDANISYTPDREIGNGYHRSAEGYEEAEYSPYTPTPRTSVARPSTSAARYPASPWNMATAQRHVQDSESPFSAPEPSFAHGFGPQSAGVATPLHETSPRVRRGERAGEAPPMSANQLGALITNAITQQTDRLLSEFRHQQNPPSMTVALPAFPSTERIGVFVDVANLLYSARSQRMSIDFGHLLEFLRGNRRLIRAHAYAPTNPDPHAEQTFLAAVKGVGYRITTKNYKTFASGARKADMDLDLCMDIVRLVDAGALDTVVLVSGDSDFLPLLEYCSDHGVRVEVAAFDDAAAMILRQSCDLFINLSQVSEIRA